MEEIPFIETSMKTDKRKIRDMLEAGLFELRAARTDC